MLNETLAKDMEKALVERGKGGINSNPPVSERRLPRVSMLSSGCARESYYYLTGAPELDSDPTSAGAAQAGQALERDVLADLMAALGVTNIMDNYLQVRVTTTHYTGSADLHVPRLALVADAKTTNAAAFEIIAREGKPKDDHVRQLAAYGIPLKATRGIIVYRGTGNTKKVGNGKVYMVFDFPLTPDMVKPLEEVAIAALAAREVGSPPPRAFPKSHWKCAGYCAFRAVCWEGA